MRTFLLRLVLLLVLVVIGLAGFTVWRNHLIDRISGNESQIAAFLKGLSWRQGAVTAAGEIDEDADLRGEFAFLGEMMGAVGLRGSDHRIDKPMLLSSDVTAVGQGIYLRQGYYIRAFLPDADGLPCVEPDPGDKTHSTRVDAKLSSKHWWAYAWPVKHGSSGNRCFYVSCEGGLLVTRNENGRYSGLNHIPAADAATAPGSPPPPPWGFIIQKPARDGMTWYVVG